MEERADEVAALVAALRLPDEKSTADVCTLEAPLIPWLALLDAQGRWVREIESDEAAASGCGQRWADMVWVTGQFGGGQDTSPSALPADDADVRVCIYRVPASEQGGGNAPAHRADLRGSRRLPTGADRHRQRSECAAAGYGQAGVPALLTGPAALEVSKAELHEVSGHTVGDQRTQRRGQVAW